MKTEYEARILEINKEEFIKKLENLGATKVADYIQKIKNPYLCKCGNMVVQSVFEETDITLIDRLIQYFRMA